MKVGGKLINIKEANKKNNERIRRAIKGSGEAFKKNQERNRRIIIEGIGAYIEKNRKLQRKLSEVCKKTSRSQLEVLTEASEYIKRKNKELYDKMNDPNIPKTERDWIRFQFFIEKYLMALA